MFLPIRSANRLDVSGHTDSALDLLYDAVDELLQRGEFEKLDSMITNVAVADLSENILIGLLTATLPARSRLPIRPKFFAEVEETLRKRGEYEDGLLSGLEG